MSKEIEKKFVVKNPVTAANVIRRAGLQHNAIEQGYIALDSKREERVRMKVDKHTRSQYVRTVKTTGGLVREEKEWEISAEEYARLFQLGMNRRITKTRYQLPLADGLTAEIDIYHGRLEGHMTVEVECSSVEQAQTISLPAWLGEVKDVTSDQRFKNQSLALRGWPE